MIQCPFNTIMYSFDLNTNLAHIQNVLANQVIKEDVFEHLENIAGVDVSFSQGNQAVAAAVLLDRTTLKITETATRKVELLFPYMSGFLGFREADAMFSVLNQLKNDVDALLVNGHGIMHPQGFGLASQVGLMMDLPTLGVAKRLIVGSHIKGGIHFPTHLSKQVVFGNEVVGAYINGNYVSIGHKISLKTAVKLVKDTSIFKTPETLRQAHIIATNTFKNVLNKTNIS